MEDIEVSDGEYKTAESPDILYSGGIGSCIVIGAIYDTKGYMLHEQPVGLRDFGAHIEPIFKDLQRDVKKPAMLQIYVAGGEIEIDDEYEKEMRKARKIVLQKIADNGFQQAMKKVQWCPAGYCQSLTLILSEKRAEYEEDEVDELSHF